MAGSLTAFLLAWMVWGMPFGLAVSALSHGMAFGLWPISWVVVSAVFFYNLTVASGDFDVIRRSLARLTEELPDAKRTARRTRGPLRKLRGWGSNPRQSD